MLERCEATLHVRSTLNKKNAAFSSIHHLVPQARLNPSLRKSAAFFTKVALLFAYINFFLYLCTIFGYTYDK